MAEEQLIGKKDTYRNFLTIVVLDAMELSGSLTTCLSLGCKYPIVIYSDFIDRFHKLYIMTAMSTNNDELLKRIENLFYINRTKKPWAVTTESEFQSKAWAFIDIFKEYMLQMKADGLYNPEISFKNDGTGNVWQDSIG